MVFSPLFDINITWWYYTWHQFRLGDHTFLPQQRFDNRGVRWLIILWWNQLMFITDSFTSVKGTLTCSRNTSRIRCCLYGGLRNSRTWPLIGLLVLINLLTRSQTRPKAERWGTFTTTWVSVMCSGFRKLIPSSVMWTTDSRPSGSRAVKTHFYFTNNLVMMLVLIHYDVSAHSLWC